MKYMRSTEEQIIGVLKEAEAGVKTADVAQRLGVSEATICNWKAEYCGLEVCEARPLRELDSENAKLKLLLADTMLDNEAPKDLLPKSALPALSMHWPIGIDGASLHKCIPPLASRSLLRPGCDEIRAPRSQMKASGILPTFLTGLTIRWSTVSSSLTNLAVGGAAAQLIAGTRRA